MIQSPYAFGMEATQNWYGDCAIFVQFWGIRVPKVYFTFLLVLLVEMAPKTKVGKGKRSKKENVDPSQGGCMVMVHSRGIAAK